jgi:hypothetical protein
MANTMTLIEAKTLGTAVSSVTFSSIPSTYTDLKIVGSVMNTFGGANTITVALNGSSTGFSTRYLEGAGSGTPASGTNTTWIASSNDITNTPSNWEIYFPNYAGSTAKSWSTDSVVENNATLAYATLIAGLWNNTAAITSIALTQSGGNFRVNSSFYLYGIKNS